jgi:hypothetical protein
MEPQSTLGDRAVVAAAVLAILLVGLFGAEPEPPARPEAVQVAKR